MDTNKTLNLEEALKDPLLSGNLKREVDSLDDFEHLDSSPVGGGKPATTKIDTTTAQFDPLMANAAKMDFGEVKKPDTVASTFGGVPVVKEKDVLSSFIERERGELKIGHGDTSDRLEKYSDSENEDDFKLSKQTIDSKADNTFKDFEEFHNASTLPVDQKHVQEQQKHIEEEKIRLEEEQKRKQEEEENKKRLLEQEKREAEQKRLEEERKRKEAEEKKRLEEEQRRKEEEIKKRQEEERIKQEEELKRKQEEEEEEKKKKAAELVCKKPVCELKPKTEKATVIEAEAFFCKMGLDAWFNPERLNPKVESLIYWRDPKKSGPVFGGVLLVLLALTYFSLISVIAYLSLLILTGTICFRIYKNIVQAVQKTGDGHPFKDLLELDVSLSQDKVKEISEVAVAHINAGVTELRRLFLVEDLVDSIKFGVLLWTLTYLGALFNGMTLIIIAWVALFTFPKVYETNKTQIDANLEIVRNKLAEITAKVKAAIPIGKKAAEEKKEQ